MASLKLNAKNREITGKKVYKLREQGMVPAIMYGPDTEPVKLSIDKVELEKIYEKGGNSSVIDLTLEGNGNHDVLIHDLSYDPVTNFIIHADLYKFREGQKLNTTIALNFVGQPRPVKEQGAIVVRQREEIDVECLPKDLVNEITVDLSKIDTLDDVIRIKDLQLPEGIEPEDDPDTMIAGVTIEKEEVDEPVEKPEMPENEQKESKEGASEESAKKEESKKI